jgi:hypothetical protein
VAGAFLVSLKINKMKTSYPMLRFILFILLVAIIIVGCQQQLAPNLAPAEPGEEYVPGQIIVKFMPGTTIEEEEQLNSRLGTTVIYTSPSAGFKVLQIPEGKTVAEMIALYLEQSIVEYAEPNYIEHILPESK